LVWQNNGGVRSSVLGLKKCKKAHLRDIGAGVLWKMICVVSEYHVQAERERYVRRQGYALFCNFAEEVVLSEIELYACKGYAEVGYPAEAAAQGAGVAVYTQRYILNRIDIG